MNDSEKERLSAFLDGETGDNREEQRVVDKLLGDREMLDAWARYHLISDCVNRRLPERLDRRLTDKIFQSLGHEPVVIAPHRSFRRYGKPLAGLAVAASVAALAILGVQQQRPGETYVPQPVETAKVVPELTTGEAVRPPVRQVSSQRLAFQPGRLQKNAQLNRYIVNYNKYRAGADMQGSLPMVSIFIEKTDAAGHANAEHANLGGINAFARYVSGHQVIVVGEAPRATVQRVANSVVSLVEDRERKTGESK